MVGEGRRKIYFCRSEKSLSSSPRVPDGTESLSNL